ncbi:MAG: protein kinase [Actinobacteria bacterium]|nr:protein kinase [Actinomycetota bacterium]
MNAGEVIAGRYRLEEALGKGGMATVWRAHDLRLERPVALKCLMPPLSEDPEYLVRFFSEAQQVARLSHPNIVRILDFAHGDEFPYLVMEYLAGGSLAVVTGTPIDPRRAAELIAAAARGAGAAHSTGMVHRDLKPGNILLSEDGTAKLADFGIAVTDAQERLTATGTAIGSPHYVSPEQASGRPVGPPSDVYSLGVVLYELLTGRRPFDSDNATALAIAHVEEQPNPPSVHRPELDPILDEIVMRCLAKDPEARFSDGAELAAALDPGAAGTTESPVAAAAAVYAADPDAAPAVPNTRRVASVALLVALFLGLFVFGVMALGRDGGRNEDQAVADVEDNGSVNVKERSSETPTNAYGEDTVETERQPGAAGTPTPTPSAEEQDESDKSAARQSDTGDDDEEKIVQEPSPEPTSEPTEGAAPEPTSTP